MSRSRRGALLPAAALAAAIAIPAALALSAGPKAKLAPVSGLRDATVLPSGLTKSPAPAIRLRDGRGGIFDTRSLTGKPYAVTFLYTSCPDVCPLIGQELQSALRMLGSDGGRVAVVAVSVDPRGDTPAAVRSWLSLHREPPNFHYLLGSEAALRPVWDAYFVAPQIRGDPSSSHTAAIWLVDRRGRRVAEIDAGAPLSPSDIAYDLRRLLSRS